MPLLMLRVMPSLMRCFPDKQMLVFPRTWPSHQEVLTQQHLSIQKLSTDSLLRCLQQELVRMQLASVCLLCSHRQTYQAALLGLCAYVHAYLSAYVTPYNNHLLCSHRQKHQVARRQSPSAPCPLLHSTPSRRSKSSSLSRLRARKKRKRGEGWCAWCARRAMPHGPRSFWRHTATV